MATDQFSDFTPSLHSPATRIEVITPSDTADLATVTRALNVAETGTVRVITVDGFEADIFVAAGVTFPIRAQRVLATGTTALGIRGLA